VKGINGAQAKLTKLLVASKQLTISSRRALEKAGRPIVAKLGNFAVPFQDSLNAAQDLDTSRALDTAFSSVDSCIQLAS
jgi:hypothetical protein